MIARGTPPKLETPCEAARRHLARGFQPVPINPREKRPSGGDGWQHKRYSVEDLPAAFPPEGNIGLLLGAASSGLVDVDLDCPEAIALAPAFLPLTEMRHGRPTARDGHYFYVVDEAPGSVKRYVDPADGETIVELRSGSDKSGAQTVIPPSIHKDTGELIVWESDGEPARVESAELQENVSGLAGLSLLARHFPAHGQRHEFALALAGMFLRDPNIDEESAYALVEKVARVGGSDNPSARAEAARSTAAKLAAGEPVTGRKRLAEIIGDGGAKVVAKACEWLGLATSDAPPHSSAPATTTQGRPRPLINSYLSVLTVIAENRENVLGGRKLRYNEMSQLPTFGGRELRDEDVSEIRASIERHIPIAWNEDSKPTKWLTPSARDVGSAMAQIAIAASYHPVRDYLNGLTWDGTPRITLVGPQALHAEDSAINRAILRRWFVSAVARPLKPGCKVDTVLVVVGKQGKLKSSAFAALAGEWFSDTPIDIHDSKRAYRTLQRVWIHEWGELESLRRARDVEQVKQFLSSQVDSYCPMYGKRDVVIPRTSIIVGTTNRPEFLADETGSRRFWPITVGQIDLPWLTTNRDQLWAEAVAAYRAGEQWWLTPEEEALLAPIHDQHAVSDAWEDAVLAFAANPTRQSIEGMKSVKVAVPLTTANVLQFALEKPIGHWNRGDEMRVGAILTRAGYRKGPRPHGCPRPWVKP